MIKFIHCVKARPELTAAEFRKFFRSDELLSLTKRMATLTNAVDYQLSLRLEIEINVELMRSRDGAAPFDGVFEIIPLGIGIFVYSDYQGEALVKGIIG